MLTQEETMKALADGKVVYGKLYRFWLKDGNLYYQYRKGCRDIARSWALDGMEGIE